MNRRSALLVTSLATIPIALLALRGSASGPEPTAAAQSQRARTADTPDWPWPDSADAVAAAPKSHQVLFENNQVRVLAIVIQPGEKEPMHTHRWPSVMTVDRPARIRYYNADGRMTYETPKDRPEPPEDATPEPEWMRPEGLHAVENIDTKPFHAIRVELKCGARE